MPASTIVLGWYYSRRQKDSREYFIGSGSLNPVLVGVSLFATHLSTISYLSVPGETISKGPIMILLIIPCYPVSYFIVRRYLLSVYMRHRVTSAYELLEDRLGLGVRLLGAGMFVVVRLSWNVPAGLRGGPSHDGDAGRQRGMDPVDRPGHRIRFHHLHLSGRFGSRRDHRLPADGPALGRGDRGHRPGDRRARRFQLDSHFLATHLGQSARLQLRLPGSGSPCSEPSSRSWSGPSAPPEETS